MLGKNDIVVMQENALIIYRQMQKYVSLSQYGNDIRDSLKYPPPQRKRQQEPEERKVESDKASVTKYWWLFKFWVCEGVHFATPLFSCMLVSFIIKTLHTYIQLLKT